MEADNKVFNGHESNITLHIVTNGNYILFGYMTNSSHQHNL